MPIVSLTRAAFGTPPASGLRATWLGHSTVLVEMGGTRLLTDPLLRTRIGHLVRHAPPTPSPGAIEAVLISHLHRDHLDIASLRRVDPSAEVVVPRGAERARALRRCGRAVRAIDVGETLRIGGAAVTAVPAVHPYRRSPLSVRENGVGFVIEAGHRVYFAGDTELFAGMGDLAEIDIALLPVWGWGPRVGPGHLDPDEAAKAVALIDPGVAVPIHWGTYLPIGLGRRYGRLLRAPGPVFAGRVAHHAPGTRVAVLAPGQSLPSRAPARLPRAPCAWRPRGA
jgi:L-ascorbate metabolism protein UlaG (beta-lactamase superfamily)